MNFSLIKNDKSTLQIQSEEYIDLKTSAKYSHNFSKENYLSPDDAKLINDFINKIKQELSSSN